MSEAGYDRGESRGGALLVEVGREPHVAHVVGVLVLIADDGEERHVGYRRVGPVCTVVGDVERPAVDEHRCDGAVLLGHGRYETTGERARA